MSESSLSQKRYHELSEDHRFVQDQTFDDNLHGSIAHFPDKVAEIPESVAYARWSWDFVPTLPSSVAHLPASIFNLMSIPRNAPTTTLGALDTLPLELMTSILSDVDLYTLHRFQRVKWRALHVVASLPNYRAVAHDASNALYAILGLKTSKWITSRMLYEKLVNADREECGDFGCFLYLITCRRYCLSCYNVGSTRVQLPLLFKDEKRI